jgi:hypothetical protein
MVGSRSYPRRFGDCSRSLCFAWQTNSSRTSSAFPKRSTRTETCDGTANGAKVRRTLQKGVMPEGTEILMPNLSFGLQQALPLTVSGEQVLTCKGQHAKMKVPLGRLNL